jgi:hypothetical protein
LTGFDAALGGLLAADFTSLAAALATLADAFFRSPRRASFFREPGFAAPDFVLALGFATVDVRGHITLRADAVNRKPLKELRIRSLRATRG